MIVERLTFRIKPGYMEKAVEMAKEVRAMPDEPHGSRIYTSLGPFDTLVYERGFENLAQNEAYWAAWWSRPETPAFMEKWHEVEAGGGGREIWTLEE